MLDLRLARISSVALLLGSAVVVAGCGSNSNSTGRTTGGDTTGGATTGGDLSGAGGTFSIGSGAGGSFSTDTDGGNVGAGTDGGACQEFKLDLVPKTPTVFVLVDRSGSMFQPISGTTSTAWSALKDATLSVIQGTQAKVRYGFGAFTGEQSGMQCPLFDKVPTIDLNNYTPIQTLYDSLKAPVKGETPTMLVLPLVGDILKADTGGGSKNILFVTDGQPDYCDDGNETCPVDSTIAQLQTLSKAGINTFVLGIKSSLTTISDDALQGFANAGLGQPVTPPAPPAPAQPLTPLDIYYQCNGVPAWKAEATAAGVPMNQPLAAYADVAGTATVYKPDATNQQQLRDTIANVVQGIKSCVLDLPPNLEIDLGQLGGAHILINGVEIPHADDNGWRMNSKTQLEFVGTACDTWKRPDSSHLDTQFPCVYDIAK